VNPLVTRGGTEKLQTSGTWDKGLKGGGGKKEGEEKKAIRGGYTSKRFHTKRKTEINTNRATEKVIGGSPHKSMRKKNPVPGNWD